MKYKQAIVFRKDLKLSTGKRVVQGCHAAVEVLARAAPADVAAWKQEGGKKVVLEVADEAALVQLFQDAKDLKLPAALIKDAGLTEIPPGTITAVGLGPVETGKIDKLTGKLPLLD